MSKGQAMTDRITDGLRWLSTEFSATADEFLRGNAPGGEMLLMGVVSKGYVNEKRGRYAVSEAGRRRLADVERLEPETEEAPE